VTQRKTALVTGASRGIGRATALELGRAGYYVVINYRANQSDAEAALGTLDDAGGAGELVRFDVTDRALATTELEALLGRLGRIDVLVNNAGIVKDSLFLLLQPDEWDQVIATTLHGFYNVTKPVLKRMVAQRQGVIVNVASLSGLVGNRGQTAYAAAKAGLIGATRALAQEVSRLGVRVNAVAPGLVETDMTKEMLAADELVKLIPMRRMGQPEEVARVIRFLCSDDASYMTGQVVSVNGGVV
jgi:3-oxoacyl-[acyl-carrier protein] reductase